MGSSSSSRNNSLYTRRSAGAAGERSKRQERMGQFVQAELAKLLHSGNIKGYAAEPLDDDLRQRISIIKSDLSPDLRQARISISVRGRSSSSSSSRPPPSPRDYNPSHNNNNNDDDSVDETTTAVVAVAAAGDNNAGRGRAVDRRRAFAWLVRNTKPIRYSLAQQLKHMKYCPDLTFVEVDVTAAVDVMALIDQVSKSSSSSSKSSIGSGGRLDNRYDPDRLPEGVIDGIDFDDVDLDDDDDWNDEDFFDDDGDDRPKR